MGQRSEEASQGMLPVANHVPPKTLPETCWSQQHKGFCALIVPLGVSRSQAIAKVSQASIAAIR